MGTFDIVHVPCPTCGERTEFQSKSGECLLQDFDLETAPPSVLRDVNRHSPYTCKTCKTRFEVQLGEEERLVRWLIGKSIIVEEDSK